MEQDIGLQDVVGIGVLDVPGERSLRSADQAVSEAEGDGAEIEAEAGADLKSERGRAGFGGIPIRAVAGQLTAGLVVEGDLAKTGPHAQEGGERGAGVDVARAGSDNTAQAAAKVADLVRLPCRP